jgi:hypothetical protein
MIKNSYVSSFKLGSNLSYENNLGEREEKLTTKNNCVWIAYDLIHITSSSNGYNNKPPVRDMSCSLTLASAFSIQRYQNKVIMTFRS